MSLFNTLAANGTNSLSFPRSGSPTRTKTWAAGSPTKPPAPSRAQPPVRRQKHTDALNAPRLTGWRADSTDPNADEYDSDDKKPAWGEDQGNSDSEQDDTSLVGYVRSKARLTDGLASTSSASAAGAGDSDTAGGPIVPSLDFDTVEAEVDPEVPRLDESTRDLIEHGDNVTFVVRAGVLRTRLRPKATLNLFNARHSKDLLALCAVRMGWKIKDAPEKSMLGDIYWFDQVSGDRHGECLKGVKKGTRVRGFPMMPEFLKKSHTFNVINKVGRMFPDSFGSGCGFPRTWLIPQQLKEFRDVLENNKRGDTFIYKPSEGAQGDGILLFRRPQDFTGLGTKTNEESVVQQYVPNPLLLDGFKFDLRLYVLVTSVDPMRAYICREGLVRVCTEKYQKPTQQNLHNVFRHLTNYSLNKRSNKYEHNEDADEGASGSKRTITAVFAEFERSGVDVEEVWSSIDSVVSRSLVALHLPLSEAYREALGRGNHGNTCFQVLGFDVLLDSDYKAWLLEINNNPSLSIDHDVTQGGESTGQTIRSPLDEIVKSAVVCGALEIVQHEKGLVKELTAHTTELYDLILDPDEEVIDDDENEVLNLFTEVRTVYNHVMASSRTKHTADPSRIRRLLRKSNLLATRGLTVHDFDILMLKVVPSGKQINILSMFDFLCELSTLRPPRAPPGPGASMRAELDALLGELCGIIHEGNATAAPEEE